MIRTWTALAFAAWFACPTAASESIPEEPPGESEVVEKWKVDDHHGPFRVLEYTAQEGTWISVDVSPDGERVAFDLLGHVYEMSIDGGDASQLTHGRSWNMFPRYGPAGDRLLFTSDRSGSNDLWIRDLATDSLSNVSEMENPVFQGSWSRDGRFVYGTALNERVRLPAYRFHLRGEKRELIPAGERAAVNHFEEGADGKVYFERHGRDLYRSGPRVQSMDLDTGDIRTVVERPGGAANPALSPDGKRLAYVHRDDRQTVLVVRDIETHQDRIIHRGLDTGRLDGGGFYGAYPNMDWLPDGSGLVVSFGGRIQRVDVRTGETHEIPFRAPVRREVEETIRFRGDIAEGTVRTRSHRWGVRTERGIVHESLGDLYLRNGDSLRNLTRSDAHETNPVYHAGSRTLYYATWDDAEMGAVMARSLGRGSARRLTNEPSQYGSIAVSTDGRRVAFVRGAGGLHDGQRVEQQTDFELGLVDESGEVSTVTDVRWIGNRYAKRPPTVLFDGDDLLFTEYEEDVLVLKRIHIDGEGEKVLYRFPQATRAVVSPDLRWIAFREFHRSYVTPFEYAGQVLEASAADGLGFTVRVDPDDGDFMEWSADGSNLTWTRGPWFCEKSLDAILDESEGAARTELSIEYDVHVPEGVIALTGCRVITMDAERSVVENATVVVRGNRIVAVGQGIEIPDGAKVFDLAGHTIMPGMFDAHGHYGSPISALNVIEEHHYGLLANLAYGVTTMYDVYGTTQKDFWITDMLRRGDIEGPRIFSVGDPIFVTKYRSKMHRSIESYEDALEHARFNADHGAPGLKDYSNHTRAARQQLAAACRETGLNLVTESFGNPQMNLTQILDGFTGIEHTMGLSPLYDDILRLFGASEIGMTPTLIVVYNGPSGEGYFHERERLWEDDKLLNFFRKSHLMTYRRPTHHFADDHYAAEMAAALRPLAAQGTRLHVGAHGNMMGLGAHWEMELFSHGGFEPMEVLEIATINGFTHHGLDHELGSIETGKLADLVILRENPLDNIRNTRSILYTVKDGTLFSGDDASRVYPRPRQNKPLYFKKN